MILKVYTANLNIAATSDADDTEGEEIKEPEVDLSSFLERQRLSSDLPTMEPATNDEDDVDTTITHLVFRPSAGSAAGNKKGKVQAVEWDAGLEDLSREKAAADASRGMRIIQLDILPISPR